VEKDRTTLKFETEGSNFFAIVEDIVADSEEDKFHRRQLAVFVMASAFWGLLGSIPGVRLDAELKSKMESSIFLKVERQTRRNLKQKPLREFRGNLFDVIEKAPFVENELGFDGRACLGVVVETYHRDVAVKMGRKKRNPLDLKPVQRTWGELKVIFIPAQRRTGISTLFSVSSVWMIVSR
jgi:hypothetical protein